jgi:hypothetical protein
MDRLALFAVRDDTSAEDVDDLLSSIRKLGDRVPNLVGLSVGENFSERGGGYTHGLFVCFRTRDDLRAYLEHPEHLAVVEKLDTTTGFLLVDYDYGP